MTVLPEKSFSSAVLTRVQQSFDWLDELCAQLLRQNPDAVSEDSQRHHPYDEMQRNMFAYAVSALSHYVMQADGVPHKKEKQAFYALLAIEGVSRTRLEALLVAAKGDGASPLQYARQLADIYTSDERMREQVLMRLTRIGMADGPLSTKEYDRLAEIAVLFEFSPKQTARIVDAADGIALSDNVYRLLKLPKTASEQDIKQAYHERMRHCHPDRWAGKVKYQYMHEQAQAKAVAVNHAYQVLMKSKCGGTWSER